MDLRQDPFYTNTIQDDGQRYLNDHVQRKVYINSRDRTAGSNTQFRIYISDTIENVKSIELHHASIPHTIYLIRAGVNDTFDLVENGVGTATITISEGSYTAAQMEAELKTQLDATSLAGATYTVSISSTTAKMTVTSNGPQFDFDFNVVTDYAVENYLGFASGVNSSTIVSSVETLVSPYVVDLSPMTELFIKFSNFTNIVRSSNGQPSCFVIPVNVNFGEYIQYNQAQTYQSIVFQSYQEMHITNLDCELVDRYGNVVDLNGSDWSILLAFRTYSQSI